MASFAEHVSPRVAAVLAEAELAGIRGEHARAIDLLRAAEARIAAHHDDDRVAIGELAVLVSAWGHRLDQDLDFVESLARAVESPSARGALLFNRGRLAWRDAHSYLTGALDEFTVAGNVRGRAITLAQLCWLLDDDVPPDHRIRLGKEGLRLAERLRDPWAIAFCAGRLAGTETYLDRPEALGRWEQAARALPSQADHLTSEIASLNQHNWALTAFQHGEYDLALRVLAEGRVLARGSRWSAEFEGLRVLIGTRQGVLAGVESAGDPFTLLAAAVAGLERAGKLTTDLADAAVAHVTLDHQMLWNARAAQAAVRVARREPNPLRDLYDALDTAHRMGARFGWEDMLLVMARVQPREARHWSDRFNDLWPTYRRGLAVRAYIAGLVAERKGYPDLLAAAERFTDIGEPVTGAQALHAAATIAPTLAEGNQLRRQAVETFQRCGADRSLAMVVRERRLHRGQGRVEVPESQRNVSTAALTSREHEVALLAAEGYTAQEIADDLHISLGTARNHLLKVRQKFGGVPKRNLVRVLGRSRPR